jgi:hypothetical protein
VALLLGAPLVAVLLTGRPARVRWLVVGLVVAVGCWLAPLLQALGSHSNVTALASSGRGLPRLGLGWGLRVVGTVGSPSPLWLHHLPNDYFGVLGTIAVNSPAVGVVVLGVLAGIATVAWRRGRLTLCALALVTLLCAVAMAVGFGLVPTRNSLNLAYMITALWALSVLVWSVVLWTLALLVAAVARRVAEPGGPRPSTGRRVAWVSAILVVPVAVLVFGAVALRSYQPGLVNVGTSASDSRSLPRIAAQIERLTPRGRVAVRVNEPGADGLLAFWLTEGAAWSLEAAGWHPGVYGMAAAYTGLVPEPGSAVYEITVYPTGQSPIVRIRQAN